MADRPRYEAAPSPHFLAALRAAVPGFDPTPLGWFELEKELKRRLRIRDQAAHAADPQACWKWSEDEVLKVFNPASASPPPAADRPAFPALPLDPWCMAPADLPPDDKAEILRLVRLVQTDFDPENDPRGWDSVADLVWGEGRPWNEVRQMDYRQLAAFFRVRHHPLKVQLGGAVETSTPSIVSCEVPTPPPVPAGKRIVVGRADLTRRLQDDWATADGKRFLLGNTVRDIATHYGLETHSSLYDNDFWNAVIKPARKTTAFRARAVDWVDSLSRDRR